MQLRGLSNGYASGEKPIIRTRPGPQPMPTVRPSTAEQDGRSSTAGADHASCSIAHSITLTNLGDGPLQLSGAPVSPILFESGSRCRFFCSKSTRETSTRRPTVSPWHNRWAEPRSSPDKFAVGLKVGVLIGWVSPSHGPQHTRGERLFSKTRR